MNTDNGAKDKDGDDCSYYDDSPEDCGTMYDDQDFQANAMCCACGGGDRSTVETTQESTTETSGMKI